MSEFKKGQVLTSEEDLEPSTGELTEARWLRLKREAEKSAFGTYRTPSSPKSSGKETLADKFTTERILAGWDKVMSRGPEEE